MDDHSSIPKRETKKRLSSVIRRESTSLPGMLSRNQKPLVVGQNLDRERSPLSFSGKDRLNHTHILGSTGTGKSKFMELLLRQDILNRKAGLCLIDPHGSLYEEVLLYASHRHPRIAERVILFDPAGEDDFVTGFNPIPQGNLEEDFLIQNLVSACLKAWGQDQTDSTPRISRWLENIFFTILANDLTLIEAAPLISIFNKEHRETLLRHVSNESILDDWRMFESSNNTQKQSLIEGAANRLRKFIGNQTIRDVIGCRSHALSFANAMQEGKIVLVNLNGRNRLTSENSTLLGIMMVNEIFRCAKARDPRDPDNKPFYVYIDEFAQFVTKDIARTLEEARKFKVFMILAHQHLEQLKEEDEYLYSSVMTNCKNKVVFGGLSRGDAEIMTSEVMTGFLDTKQVRYDHYVTQYRPNLKKVLVKQWGQSDGTSESEGTSSTQGRSTTEGQSDTHGESNSIGSSTTRSNSVSESSSQTEGRSTSDGTSATKGNSTTKGSSETEGTSSTVGTSKSSGSSRTEGESFSEGTSQSRTQGSSESHSRSTSDNHSKGKSGENKNKSDGYGYSQGKQESRSHSTTDGKSTNQTKSFSTSTNSSESESNSESTNQSHSTNQSESQSKSKAVNRSKSVSESKGRTHSKTEGESSSTNESVSENKSTSRSKSDSQNESESQSETHSRTHSKSEGESETWINDPISYQELSSRTFWSIDDIEYMSMTEMKTQDTAHAFIKCGSNQPYKVKIEHVSSVRYSPRTSPPRIEKFITQSREANTECYSDLDQARLEIKQRQISCFGEAFSFSSDEPEPEKTPLPDPEENSPFA